MSHANPEHAGHPPPKILPPSLSREELSYILRLRSSVPPPLVPEGLNVRRAGGSHVSAQ
jgi:hypothetical protein